MQKHFIQFVLGLTLAMLLTFLWDVLNHSTYPVHAQGGTGIVRVAKTGIDTPGCGSAATAATPCQTLQFAIDQASAGEEILVSAGVYTQVQQKSAPADYEGSTILTQTIYITKNLVVRGGYTTANWIEPNPISNTTIVDAMRLGRVVVVHGTDNVLIEGLQLTGGDATNLGGQPFFANDAGGGFYMLSGMVTLSNTQIISNIAKTGGGIWNKGQLTLINSIVSTNTAKNSGDSSGGGISSEGGALIIDSSTIYDNNAEYVGQ